MAFGGSFMHGESKLLLTEPDYRDRIDYRNSIGVKRMRLFDSELKVMNIIWESEPISAKEVSIKAGERYRWNKNTTYTVINKLIGKEYIRRSEPGFMCESIVKREDARRGETKGLIERLYGGSKKALFSALLEDEKLSAEELGEIARMIEEKGGGKEEG